MFAKCSGLMANNEKTAIYFGNVSETVQLNILLETGFVKGSFPFRYLGVPLNSKRLFVADCDVLVDKITGRISCWSSRNLSYAARVVLVNSVLMSIHTYWAQVFLLPKSILAKISQLLELSCGMVSRF